MDFKVNYNECLVNLANSIRKYYGLKTHHSTLSYVDDILEERKPETVILFLFDGMGSKMLERIMPEDSYFRKHMIKEITSVYPPTTTAATTSVRTGLTPMEHGFMGWNTYLKQLNKTITLFLYGEKMRAYLINGAKSLPGFSVYPNPQTGWGALCALNSIFSR